MVAEMITERGHVDLTLITIAINSLIMENVSAFLNFATPVYKRQTRIMDKTGKKFVFVNDLMEPLKTEGKQIKILIKLEGRKLYWKL
jgi:hypothetical protein